MTCLSEIWGTVRFDFATETQSKIACVRDPTALPINMCDTQDPFGFGTDADIPKPKQQPCGTNHIAFTQAFVNANEYSDFTYEVLFTRQSTVHPDVTSTVKLTDVKPEEIARLVYNSKELSKTKDKEAFMAAFASEISTVNNRAIESKEAAAKRKRELDEEAEEAKIIERHEQRKQVRCEFVLYQVFLT